MAKNKSEFVDAGSLQRQGKGYKGSVRLTVTELQGMLDACNAAGVEAAAYEVYGNVLKGTSAKSGKKYDFVSLSRLNKDASTVVTY